MNPDGVTNNVLVTGGAGYIGSHVVLELCDNGYEVTVFDNLSSGLRENLDKRAEFVEGDILDTDHLDRLCSERQFDAVMHFAALKAAGESMEKPDLYAWQNITGTISMLNAMHRHGIKHIIFSSTAAVYGDPQYLPVDEDHPLEPINFYGFTKLEIERLLKWYSDLSGIRYAALRYFNAAGYDVEGRITGLEQNPANLLPVVMETASGRRQTMQVFGNDYETPDGTCIRDYIHVSDLATGHLKALHYLEENDRDLTLNLATGSGFSVLEVLRMAENITGRKINYEITGRREGDPEKLVAVSKKGNDLGWHAEHSGMETLIRSMWEVYKPVPITGS